LHLDGVLGSRHHQDFCYMTIPVIQLPSLVLLRAIPSPCQPDYMHPHPEGCALINDDPSTLCDPPISIYLTFSLGLALTLIIIFACLVLANRPHQHPLTIILIPLHDIIPPIFERTVGQMLGLSHISSCRHDGSCHPISVKTVRTYYRPPSTAAICCPRRTSWYPLQESMKGRALSHEVKKCSFSPDSLGQQMWSSNQLPIESVYESHPL
jgi:hypothetical protein